MASKEFDKRYLHYVITALIVFGSPYVPTIDPITPLGMAVLGSFLGCIYGWTFLGMVWPSIIGIVGLGMACGMPQVLAAGFGSPIIPFLFLTFAVLGLLNETRATEALAQGFVTNKLVIGRPCVFMFIFFVGVAMCALINVFVSMLVFTQILFNLCKKLDIKPYTKFPLSMLIGIVISIQLSQIMIPFKSSALTLTAAYNAMTSTGIDYLKYMSFTVPMTIILLLSYVAIIKWVFRVDVSILEKITEKTFGEKKPLNREQKIAVGTLVAVIVILVAPSVLPKTWFINIWLSKLTLFGQGALVILLVMLIKKEDGNYLFDFGKFATKGISWEAIFMTCFILPISQFLTAEGTGITTFITNLISPMTSLSPIMFILAFMIFATIITNFANNVVLAIALLPVIISFAGQVGMDSLGLALLLFMVTQFAIFTPGASAFAGLAFSNKDWVEPVPIMKYGFVVVILMLTIALCIGLPLAMFIF